MDPEEGVDASVVVVYVAVAVEEEAENNIVCWFNTTALQNGSHGIKNVLSSSESLSRAFLISQFIN